MGIGIGIGWLIYMLDVLSGKFLAQMIQVDECPIADHVIDP